LAEITPGDTSTANARTPRLYEITPVWESAELTHPPAETSIPAGLAKPSHTYRVRVRMKDVTGRWSHWSAPIEFTPTAGV
jgi:hypothetical protein